jgi:hypothetical protein
MKIDIDIAIDIDVGEVRRCLVGLADLLMGGVIGVGLCFLGGWGGGVPSVRWCPTDGPWLHA